MIWVVVGALVIGLCLGVMGSGGSVLTVPILTVLVGQSEKVAIAGSLAIVGVVSLLGGIPYARRGLVDFRSLLYFGVPGMVGSSLGVLISRAVDGHVQMIAFALLMLVAVVLMLRGRSLATPGARRSAWRIVVDGLVVGALTGFVGVGGGFLVVPALVLLGGLGMHQAIGTSLLIIAMKSASGFLTSLAVLSELGLRLDVPVIVAFSVVGVVGSQIGRLVATRVRGPVLQRGFAAFLLAVGVFVLFRSVDALTAGA